MMRLKRFIFNPFSENTYVLYDHTMECIIIDPGCSNEQECMELKNFISREELKPVKLVNTHCHIDHIMGNRFVKAEYDIPFIIHQLELPVLQSGPAVGAMYGVAFEASPLPDEYMKEGEVIRFGNSSLEVLFTPGHSPGSICLLARKEKMLIGGDVLFRGSIGRTDLPGGDFNTLIGSIRTRLFVLDEDITVYPGHMEETTIGYEKKTNPFLSSQVR